MALTDRSGGVRQAAAQVLLPGKHAADDLVEIVVGSRTSPDLVTAATNWVAGLGKTPITVKNSPGFVVTLSIKRVSPTETFSWRPPARTIAYISGTHFRFRCTRSV